MTRRTWQTKIFIFTVRLMINWQRLSWSRFIAGLAALAAAATVAARLTGVLYPRVSFWALVGSAAILAFTERVQGGKSKPITEHKKMHKRRILPLIIIGALLLTLTGCDRAKAAKGAAQTANGIAVSIAAGVVFKRELAAGGVISPDGVRAIGQALLDADRAALKITDQAECFTNYSADTKAAVIQAADDLLQSLAQLNAQGVLHIHSVEGQRRFAVWMAAASAGVVTLRVLIGSINIGAAEIPADVKELCRRAGASLRDSETLLLADLGEIPSQ